MSDSNSLPDSTAYQEALKWKEAMALFHADQSDKVSTGQIPIPTPDLANLACEAHVIASMQALHSMSDIMGQIINKAVLNDQLSESDVSLSNVRRRLRDQSIASGVISAITDLKNTSEYKYINAFVNTIKHRRLLNLNRRFEFTSSGSSTSSTLGI